MALSVVGLVTLGSAIAVSAFTLTWFSNKNYIEKDITGSVSGAYFAYGDGKSKETAFGINEPRHLYNLAWLQYMGTFNKDEDDDGVVDQQYYFEIDPNISILNMSGWITPPIGTETYPFVGNFNGNNAVISGLTITSNGDNLTTKPDKVRTEGFTAPSIIGFFGVVGKYSDTSLSYTLETNSIYNLYLDKITIQNSSSTKNVLAGLLAGYVNGYMTECGVYRGKFDFVNGTTNITEEFSNVSDYSLIGSYDSASYKWVDIPGGGGTDNDFGGSIDFASFDKRVSYVMGGDRESVTFENGKIDSAPNQNNPSTNSNMNATAYRFGTSSKFYYWDVSNGQINNAGLSDGTYMPLNIDKTKLTAESGKSIVYDVSNGEPILDTNTGYITGYESQGNSSPRISHSETPYNTSTKRLNLSIANYPKDSTLFDSSNYSFLYYDQTVNKTYRLQDSYNSSNIANFVSDSGISGTKTVGSNIKFERYDSVKKDLLETLKDGTSDTQISNGVINLHALMLYSKSGTTIDSFGTFIGKNVKINKKTYENYALYKNGINFTLGKSGYVTMVCGAYRTSYSSSTSKDGFYSLYSLTRSDDCSSITSKEEIKTIYMDGDDNIEYNPSTTSGKTLKFDFSSLNSGKYLIDTAMFYFEFPLDAGDYFLCEEKNRNAPYLLYLDIGANASGSGGQEREAIIQDIDFVLSSDNNYTGIVKINTSSYVASEVLFNINGTSSAQQFYFMRSSTGIVLYCFEGTGLSITVIGTKDNASKNDESKWTTA